VRRTYDDLLNHVFRKHRIAGITEVDTRVCWLAHGVLYNVLLTYNTAISTGHLTALRDGSANSRAFLAEQASERYHPVNNIRHMSTFRRSFHRTCFNG
jgi:hypothetical protein